ncbi:metal ABC transporter solute-binding protein, Zn/Mn family [Pigmentiphaga litoralis]|uniref:Zinc/manganese transport system substrate-binding protein n=1 Tax=Pigmentiphaga litoralis TaxID=516702 RepID=A0A7Y9LNB9_9BURK|nr:zinc ABC transporter substrate-binding protein [Pigmentiphaga litoralis]NYE23241.1 zinc/manganese transport system substrate-binding protein [Pigmentiphaga litoralis]NYE83145.1 zinc/manganese transport system substrate-binding protein [Pigmentiphaga litoralis]
MFKKWMALAVVTMLPVMASANDVYAQPAAKAPDQSTPPAPPSSRLPVVASFSILGDLVNEVGGDRVAVTTLVGRDSDAHVFQPAPKDVKTVASARVLVIHGLGFDGWMNRLVSTGGAAAGRIVVEASQGLPARPQPAPKAAKAHPGHSHDPDDDHEHDHNQARDRNQARDHNHGPIDPHAWQDPRNVVTYVRNIASGLTRADPAGAGYYAERATAYTARLAELDGWITQRIAQVPAAQRKVITSHDAFGYFAARYGVTMVAAAGVSTNADAGARDMADIIRLMRRDKIKALFLENIANPRLVDQISRETGAQVGGRLYSDALSAIGGPASTYLAMMRHNVDMLVAGMQRN